MVFGLAAADPQPDLFDGWALACAQQCVGGAVDVGGADAAASVAGRGDCGRRGVRGM